MIECPFCLAEVDRMAVACRSCGRDLAGHMYLLRRVETLQQSLTALQASVTIPPSDASESPSAHEPESLPVGRGAGEILRYAVLPVLLLVVAHHLIVFTLDESATSLLIASLVIPLPFSAAAIVCGRQTIIFWLITYAVAAVLAVLGQAADTILTVAGPDKTIMPVTSIEWTDDLEFVGSIFMSFASGLLASLSYLFLRYPEHRSLHRSISGLEQLGRRLSIAVSNEGLDRVGKYISSLGTLITAVAALYLGMKRL